MLVSHLRICGWLATAGNSRPHSLGFHVLGYPVGFIFDPPLQLSPPVVDCQTMRIVLLHFNVDLQLEVLNIYSPTPKFIDIIIAVMALDIVAHDAKFAHIHGGTSQVAEEVPFICAS